MIRTDNFVDGVFRWREVDCETVIRMVMDFRVSPSKDFYGFSNRIVREILPKICPRPT